MCELNLFMDNLQASVWNVNLIVTPFQGIAMKVKF